MAVNSPLSLLPNHLPCLWTKALIETSLQSEQLPPWAAKAYSEFETKMYDRSFPCTFAGQAHKHGKLRYAFVESAVVEADLFHLRRAIIEYLEYIDTLPSQEAVMAVLIIFVNTNDIPLELEAHHQHGWHILQFLHEHDPAAWSADVPLDPEHVAWAFCFAGVPLFFNFSSPAYKARHSRNVGDVLTLVLQPREGFDIIAGDTIKGQQVRAMIRRRIESYDAIPPSPELGTYGDQTKREWRQYGLLDTNEAQPGSCPLHLHNIQA